MPSPARNTPRMVKETWGLGYYSRSQHEHAYLLAKGRPEKPKTAISDVLEWRHISPQLHANQKPLGAILKLVNCFSPDNGLVLDPFCGSGTTLVAARRLKRRAVGIEIEECFCELADLRLSQEVFDFEDSGCTIPQQLSLDKTSVL